MARAGQLAHTGIRLRDANRPMGRAMSMPSTEARMAISSDSVRPLSSESGCAMLGGIMRPIKRAPLPSPVTKRAQVKSRREKA